MYPVVILKSKGYSKTKRKKQSFGFILKATIKKF